MLSGLRALLRFAGAVVLALICIFAVFLLYMRHGAGRIEKARDSIHTGMTDVEVFRLLPGDFDYASIRAIEAANPCPPGGSKVATSEATTPAELPCDPQPFSLTVYGCRDDQCRIHLRTDPGVAQAVIKTVSRRELVSMINAAAPRADWRISLTYTPTATPMHLSFAVLMGANGKVKEVTQIRNWD